MSTDLGLDPSDPLNLLLHNTSQNNDSGDSDASQQFDDGDNVQDWSSLSALWADASAAGAMESSKSYSDMMPMDFPDLNSSMAMDMDFNPSMAIEPSALHYDPMKYANLGGMGLNYAYDDQYALSSELLASQFPFTFQFGGDVNGSSGSLASDSDSPQSFAKERRLSVTSSSSSSGASSSPVPESLPSPSGYASDAVQPKEEPTPIETANPYTNDPAAELAARVRQTAGVMLAVPMTAHLQGLGAHIPTSNSSQPKLPIPRLPRHSPSAPKSTASTSSSAASTPPPSTPPPSNAPFKLTVNTTSGPAPSSSDMASTPVAGTPASALPRPKTSHTTIERRYRTNLNARIQSLRMAVPALRVLEDREGGNGKKIKKNLKGSVIVKGSSANVVEGDDGSVDVIDERGFVDGVKVARKCSKANVLGKAVEYIRVLKKREMRLRAEQAGLKTLVAGLVGGPALVREWEREWRASFGGEERDEVEGEDGDGEGEGDDEDSDEDDDDEEGARKRKRAKASTAPPVRKVVEKKKPVVVAATSANVMIISGEQASGANPAPEKRKRGRPRKVLPPVSLAPAPPTAAAGAQQQATKQEQQGDPMVQDDMAAWVQQQQQQVEAQTQPQQYLLAVFALFSFFNSPLTSSPSSSTHHQHTGTVLSAAHPPLAYAPDIISQFAAPSATPAAWSWQEYVQLFHLAVSVLVLASFVFSWLGVSFGLDGVGRVVKRGRSMSVRTFRKTDTPTAKTTRKEGGPTGWARLGEESVLEGRTSSLSLYERLKIYRAISSKRDVSVSDLTTLAMVVRGSTGVLGGLAKVKARFMWDAAKNQTLNGSGNTSTKVAESLVFEELDDVEDAAALLSGAERERMDENTPLEVIAGMVVKERVKRHLGKLFVRAVASEEEEPERKAQEEEEEEWRKTVDAARELGGRVETLGRMFERVWKVSAAASALEEEELSLFLDTDNANAEGVDEEIRALLLTLILYRRLFAASTGGAQVDFEEDGCVTPTAMSTLLSPPPSPRSSPGLEKLSSRENSERARMLLALRTALGSRVFEDGEVVKAKAGKVEEERMGLGLEDAKDRVVDMVVEVERRERGS